MCVLCVQGDSPRAREIAALLGQKMDSLETEMRRAITRKVVEDFKDPLGPLRAMTEAAYAAPGNYFDVHLTIRNECASFPPLEIHVLCTYMYIYIHRAYL